MSYGPHYRALARRTPVYVDQILKGATPASLPVEQAMRFDFVINLKTAQSLGLTLPPPPAGLSGRGDQVAARAGARHEVVNKGQGRGTGSPPPRLVGCS